MPIFIRDQLYAAHKKSDFHREEILNSVICGCFYCLINFTPAEIKDWINEEDIRGACALCPKCGIDAVIGSSSGFPVDNKDFLKEMHRIYF